ncbi:hypothetical protein HFN58_08480 [Rhizobium leguminosarum]|nr:hypothetical protein [Rhizobium leguminosarum]NKM03856.1 hypothetical protein [Rhizobium leguminosarum bv. viciae]
MLASHRQTVRCGAVRRGGWALFCGCLAVSIRTGAITPLLGGIGPTAIMSLLHNTLIAASMRSGLGVPLLR